MTTYELVSALVAVIALVVSVVSLVRTRKIAKRQIELQEKQVTLQSEQALLAKLQRELLEKHQLKQSSADVRIYTAQTTDAHRFLVRNVGAAPALDVSVTIISRYNGQSPLIEGDTRTKLPIRKLLLDQEIALLASLAMGIGTSFDASTSWAEANGERRTNQCDVSF